MVALRGIVNIIVNIVRIVSGLSICCDCVLTGQRVAVGALFTAGLVPAPSLTDLLAHHEQHLLVLAVGLLVSFVPYLGFIVGIITAGIAALMQFQELLPLAFVVMVFGIGQLLEGMVLTPLLLGERIGLHPVAVIFSVMAGAQLFGFFGILLALPVAAVVMVLLRYAHERYLGSTLYAEKDGQ